MRSRAADTKLASSEAEQCNDWVQRIYYANIAMNNKAIADVVAEIADYYYKLQRTGE